MRFVKGGAVKQYLKGCGKWTSRSLFVSLDAILQRSLDNAAHNAGPFKKVIGDDVEVGQSSAAPRGRGRRA